MHYSFDWKSMQSLMDLSCGNWYTQMLYVVCVLKVADVLPMSIDALATHTDTHRDSLYRLIRALCTRSIFHIDEEGIVHNTDTSSLLISTDTSCMYHYCMMRGSYYQYHSWSSLIHCIRTGTSGITNAIGTSMFEYLSFNDEERLHFDSAMEGISRQVGMEIVSRYSYLLPFAYHLVDIGGGNGTLLRQLLHRGDLSGTVYDISVSDRTDDNITYVQGDMFKGIPLYGDVYIMKYVLHDWSDENCITILKGIRSGSKLYIIESIIDDNSSYHKMLDIQMMVCLSTGARERTYEEYARILSEASISIDEVLPLNTLNLSILVCTVL